MRSHVLRGTRGRDTLLRMCGRFTLYADPETLVRQFNLEALPELAPRYNIAPTQPVAIVRDRVVRGHPLRDASAENDAEREVRREWTHVIWGLIPSWAKDPSIGARMINARSETAAEKPSFRAAMRRRRCLVPADGFYEWKRVGKGKQPHYITSADGHPFAFAGLWETWAGPDGGELETCTVLTTEPNGLLADIHNRMPVILAPEDYDEWMVGGAELVPREVDVLRHLFRAYPAEKMRVYPVSQYVNNARNEGETCITPLD